VLGTIASLVVLALAATGLLVARPGPVDGWLNGAGTPKLDKQSAAGFASEPEPSPVLAGVAADAPAPTAAGVQAAIDPLVTGSGLGSRVNVSVLDMATGQSLYGHNADSPTVPASTTKLVTAVAVLAARGSTYRIPTRVVAGAQTGEVVLVGGGDPTLAINATGSYPGAARLDQLAAAVKATLGGATPTRVTVDSSLFTGPVLGPWDADIPHNGYAGPTVALMTDGARINPKRVKPPAVRYDRPDIAAGKAFAKALGLPSAAVNAVSSGKAPAAGAELGRVESMPIGRMVEFMLADSDNVIAEMLNRQVAVAKGQSASYQGGAAAARDVLGGLGLPAAAIQLVDGSGFSRQDHLTPALLTSLLRLAAEPSHPELHGIFSGLPVAGWSGTLSGRYRSPAARSQAGAGVVRAKTGTLARVNAISGIVVDADGRLLAFAVLADQVPLGQSAAQEALDRIAAALAGCGCR
jgi:D-alanyl-D-alanine carboxypeptidase/D-alanyl-D-alanine-endopeptidase (penicillin-binding protein 4)